MAKGTGIDEIMILKFFETGPIEKAELLFSIVREKMRERLSGRAEDGAESAGRGSVRKRQTRMSAETPPGEAASSQEV